MGVQTQLSEIRISLGGSALFARFESCSLSLRAIEKTNCKTNKYEEEIENCGYDAGFGVAYQFVGTKRIVHTR